MAIIQRNAAQATRSISFSAVQGDTASSSIEHTDGTISAFLILPRSVSLPSKRGVETEYGELVSTTQTRPQCHNDTHKPLQRQLCSSDCTTQNRSQIKQTPIILGIYHIDTVPRTGVVNLPTYRPTPIEATETKLTPSNPFMRPRWATTEFAVSSVFISHWILCGGPAVTEAKQAAVRRHGPTWECGDRTPRGGR